MNRQTFERLYEEYAEPLYGFLAYRTGNPALAEDLLADTFERAWSARRRFDLRRGSQKTWLYSIALNRLRDDARQKVVEQRALQQAAELHPLGHNGNGNGDIDQAEVRQLLLAGLDTLDPAEREALALRYGADLALKEIAQVLRVPRSTVEGRIHRGLKRLWHELADEHARATAAGVSNAS
jgi:RNA polymerase sigma factor (sigma-70 family)